MLGDVRRAWTEMDTDKIESYDGTDFNRMFGCVLNIQETKKRAFDPSRASELSIERDICIRGSQCLKSNQINDSVSRETFGRKKAVKPPLPPLPSNQTSNLYILSK